MSDVVMLTGVRLSFPQLVEAKAVGESEPRFGADLLIDPNSADWQKAMSSVMVVATGKWADKTQGVMGMIMSDRKLRCFGQGAERIDKKTFQPYVGYAGNFYISAINKNQPQIVDHTGMPLPFENQMAIRAAASRLYGGCYVNAAIKFWPQDNTNGRAIRCELVAIQFARDGEPFGEGMVDVTGMFGAVAAPAGSPMQGMGMQPMLGMGAMPNMGGMPAMGGMMPNMGMQQMPPSQPFPGMTPMQQPAMQPAAHGMPGLPAFFG